MNNFVGIQLSNEKKKHNKMMMYIEGVPKIMHEHENIIGKA